MLLFRPALNRAPGAHDPTDALPCPRTPRKRRLRPRGTPSQVPYRHLEHPGPGRSLFETATVAGDELHHRREGCESGLQRMDLRLWAAEDPLHRYRPQLTAKPFLETCRILGVRNIFTSTCDPRTNGQTEHMNRTMESMLRCYVAEDQENCDEYLPALAFAYNRGVHKSTRTTLLDPVLSVPPALCVPKASGTSQISVTPGPRRPSCDAARGHPLHRQAAGEGAGKVQTGLRQGRCFGEPEPQRRGPGFLGRPRYPGRADPAGKTED